MFAYMIIFPSVIHSDILCDISFHSVPDDSLILMVIDKRSRFIIMVTIIIVIESCLITCECEYRDQYLKNWIVFSFFFKVICDTSYQINTHIE